MINIRKLVIIKVDDNSHILKLLGVQSGLFKKFVESLNFKV
jgi:hypothetical protein